MSRWTMGTTWDKQKGPGYQGESGNTKGDILVIYCCVTITPEYSGLKRFIILHRS